MIFIVKIIIILLTGLIYSMGGLYNKKIKRFLAPIPVTILCLYLNKNILSLLMYPLLSLTYSIGYGYKSKLMNIFNNKRIVRGICGFFYALSAIPIIMLNKNYNIFLLHIIISTFMCIVLGTQIINLHITKEECLIGIFSILLIPWI